MKISKVKTCVKIADVVKNPKDTAPLIHFDYSNCADTAKLKIKGMGFVYIITSNKVIKKIGYSKARGGIKHTLGAYQGGNRGRPSIRTFGIHFRLAKEIENGNKPEIYAIFSDEVSAKIKGLWGEVDGKISASHEMEELCKKQYVDVEGKLPAWNIQETKGAEWDDETKAAHAELLRKSLTLNKKQRSTRENA